MEINTHAVYITSHTEKIFRDYYKHYIRVTYITQKSLAMTLNDSLFLDDIKLSLLSCIFFFFSNTFRAGLEKFKVVDVFVLVRNMEKLIIGLKKASDCKK